MLDRPVFLPLPLPLAQLNTTTPPATGAAPAPIEHAPPVAGVPAVPASAGAGTQGAGGAGGLTATSTAPGTQPATSQPAPPDVMSRLMIPMLGILALLWFFTMRGKNKDEKKRKQLLADLKKGDKIMTIGGMVANVVSVDGDEVVLKIDESANVKARYRKSAIQEVLTAEEKK